MGKPTGFLEYPRAAASERSPLERVKDWMEGHPPFAEGQLREQASRCMDCSVPYCHTGALLAGTTAGCPLSNLIPEWNDLVYRGQWKEAYIRLAKTNNFPEVTGRVCPAPCEGSCTCALHGEAVTIKALEAAIADRAFAEDWVVAEPPPIRTGKRVSVVGSGPAGLACAAQLNKAGHTVTVYERSDRVGGLMMYGIPNMKLDKSVVDRRVKLLAEEGVRFVTGTDIGTGLPTARLLQESDAVVLAGGASAARELPLEGRALKGIYLAMEFLHQSTQRLLDGPGAGEGFISARGKRVVVIGGGDTGTDCVGTAIRAGAASVIQLELAPRPPDARAADNPWPQWPRIYQLDYAQEEAKALWGEDPRQYQVLTRRFVGDQGGNLTALELAQVQWAAGEDGRFKPVEVPGSERVLQAELVLLAVGFVGPEPALPTLLQCKLDGLGNVWVDENKMTSVPGVFAAGDMVRGPSLVVWAIREGRLAAQAVDRYLSYGETVLGP